MGRVARNDQGKYNWETQVETLLRYTKFTKEMNMNHMYCGVLAFCRFWPITW
jgi:hypothetical protein